MTKKAHYIRETLLDKELRDKIDSKITQSETDALYRKKNIPISEDDLNSSLRLKIQSGGTGTGAGGPAYDDTELRGRIVDMESSKADLKDLSNYRHKNDPITELDMGTDYFSLKNEVAKNKENIASLSTSKAGKEELDNYRANSMKIGINDLSDEIVYVLATVDPNLNGVQDGAFSIVKEYYGDKELLNALLQDTLGENHDAIKAINYIYENFRRKSDAIGKDDIDEAVLQAIDNKIESNAEFVLTKIDTESEDRVLKDAELDEKISKHKTENIEYVDKKVVELNDVINAVNTEIVDIKNQLAANETSHNILASEVSNIDIDMGHLKVDLTMVKSNIIALQNEDRLSNEKHELTKEMITNTNNILSSLGTSIDTQLTVNTQLTNSIAMLEGSISVIEDRLLQIEEALAGQQEG